MNLSSKHLVLIAALGLSLSACNGKKTESMADAKIAMKVNGEPISVAEFNNSGNMHGDRKQAVSGSMLKMTVEAELLRQAAIQAKLDTDEDIRASIANSTRMILATAYMKKQLSAVGKPSEAEINDYYKQNPARFADRKQYEIREFSIQPPPGKAGEIQAQLNGGKKPDAFDQWLTENKIAHSNAPASVTSDQLPDEVLQKLRNVAVGGAVVVGSKDQMNVIYMLSEQMQPIALAQATTLISNMLMEKHKRETVTNMMKQLHDKAKVEYVPPYTANGLSAPVDKQ